MDTISRNSGGSFNKFLDPDSDANDFQNLIISSLFTDTSPMKILAAVFFYLTLLTDRQTGKQTDRQTMPGGVITC